MAPLNTEIDPELVAEQPKKGVHVRTYGCQMNEYDSEKVLNLLSKDYQPVATPEEAEVVFVNTCSVREKAESRLFGLLGGLAKLKSERPELIIGVGGCVAQQEGEKIIRRSKAVDFVVGTHNLSLIPSLVKQAQRGANAQVAVDYREEWEEFSDSDDAFPIAKDDIALPVDDFSRTFHAYYSPTRAMVAIQRGCNKNCSFCVVPNTRGPEVSRAPEEVLREIRLKARMGAKEVLLLGQTVNSYGRDLTPRYSFDRLVREIAEIEGIIRIRFTSPHPAEVKPEFISLYREVPQLCAHIHLPLQSGSDRVLKLMNRNYRTKRYLEIIDAVKAERPDIAITSDFIVGFPTETDAEFAETLQMIERVRYHMSYSFCYSVRPNTVAKDNYIKEQLISKEVSSKRLKELQIVQENIAHEINRKTVGERVEVLVEGKSTNISSLMRGRISQNTPVELIGADDIAPKIGAVVMAQVEHAGTYGLRARICA